MTTRRAGYILLITYLVIGLAMQTVSCAWPSLGQDGQPSDVPCAGIPWSFFVILQWPLFAFFDLAVHQMTPLGITGLFGMGVMLILIILFRRFRVTKKPVMIEVEKTFAMDKETVSRLTQQATFLRSVTLKDIYYDTADYWLTKRDWWLRSRNGQFELKTVYGEEQPVHERTHDHYREWETEREIINALGWHDERPLAEIMAEKSYVPFATIVTERRKYEFGNFHIDIDETDFGYSCVDIEQMVDEPQVETATAAIESFANELGLRQTTAGKVIEFLKRFRPDHYRALKEAGVA